MSFLNPERVLQEIGIFQPGIKVGDFGCGAGYNTFVLAKLVGEEGEVIAVDILRERLELVDQKSNRLGLLNIKTIHADLEKEEGTGIPSSSLQAVLLANVLFQSDKKEAILNESKRVLEGGGSLVVIDWEPNGSLGPNGYRIPKDTIKELARKTGFTLEQEFPVDTYHYGLLFRNSENG